MNLDEKFWLAICFIIFIILAYKPIKKAVLATIDRRIASIRTELECAKNMRMEAEIALKKSEGQLKQAVGDRSAILKKAKADIAKLSKESKKELEIMLQHKERDVEDRLEQLKASAVKDLRTVFSKKAKEMTEKYFSDNKSTLPKDDILASHLLKK